MVPGLCSPLHDCDCLACVYGSLREDLEKERLGNVVRTGAADQVPARFQQLHGAKIDFLIAALGRGDAGSILGEGRRIENDGVKAAANLVVFL
jgi:hypothetical protein